MLANSGQNGEKRTLTKVRRNFLQKKGEDEDKQLTLVNPITLHIKDNNIYILSSTTGLVEINRRIYSGPQYLNQHFNITNSLVQDYASSKAVTLAFSLNKNNEAIPWEYAMKRLESFGDLDLALWAHRIKKYNQNYTKLIGNLIKLHYSNDVSEVKSRQEKLAQISHDIENRCLYYKVVHSFSQDSTVLKEMSYSERFLEQMGYTTESFLKWTNQNGLPSIFDHGCPVYLQVLKSLFEGSMLALGAVNKGQEFKTVLVDKQGLKKDVVVETVYLVEASQDALLVTGYYILKDDNKKMLPQISYGDSKASCLKQKKIQESYEKEDAEKMQGEETDH